MMTDNHVFCMMRSDDFFQLGRQCARTDTTGAEEQTANSVVSISGVMCAYCRPKQDPAIPGANAVRPVVMLGAVVKP